MLVLAVDPGSCTGWALAEDGRLLRSGIVREPPKRKATPTLEVRQAEYARAARHVMYNAVPPRPLDTLVVEWPTGARFVRPLLRLAWRAGVWAGAIYAGQCIEITPSEWASAAGLPTGDGFEASYIERGRLLLEREPETPDEAAAVCLAVHASQRLAAGLPVGRTAEEAVEARRTQQRASAARRKAKR